MPRFSPLDRDVQYVKGVGPRRARILERLGLRTARDLLYHTPRRYEDASTVSPIGSLETGMEATIVGRVVSKGVLPTRGGLRIFQAVVKDRSGYVECAWPGQPFLDRVIERGDLLLLSGTVRFFHGKQFHPREFTTLAAKGEGAPLSEGRVFPIYPTTEGLPHRHLRQLIADNLDELLHEVETEDVLPEQLLAEACVPPLPRALDLLHRPPSVAAAEEGRRRLALEELFFLQLIHARTHREATQSVPGIAFEPRRTLVRQLYRSLPFELTGAQRRVLRQIGEDMSSGRRMNRLLQGDVGSGKTVVALFAALRAIENGYQAAMMAPTELLAEQHARTVRGLLADTGVTVEILTGRLTGTRRREARERVASGEAQLVIGTHALIQESVEFHRLGLAIVDEQHRFGVRQRLALSERGDSNTEGSRTPPDVLVMSATPIPRSLALTLYGDLDVCLLDERPSGRGQVRTAIRRPKELPQVFQFVTDEVARGRQAYVVYPLVEESEALELTAATTEFERLKAEGFSGLELGLLHGQLPSDEKERVMEAFRSGALDVLVATSVVEVGIDVPNATVMVVQHAERFGLSQLHQLRGRIGRGASTSYCIIVSELGHGSERLRIFARTEDGFRIAEEDLRLRGQGDLFGPRQSGLPAFRWARLETDLFLLNLARTAARGLVAEDPDLASHVRVRDALERTYQERAEMFRTG
ncbi:MAG: ATP-dependent DNA helicase RecG [Gemmatimonas sp.]|nr:ATP-dependent DNA helicase RecG [Gemmatimonas sp.]